VAVPSSSVSVALSVTTTPSTSVTSSPPTFPSSVPAFRLHSSADFLLLYHLLSLRQSRVASVAQITRAREMEASFRSQLRGDIAFFPDADDAPISVLLNRFGPTFAAWSMEGRND